MIAGGMGVISSGIEPFFDREYSKNTVGGEIVKLPENTKCAMDISIDDHIKMLEAVQKNLGSASSKTINCPENTTVEEIESAIIDMYRRRIVKSCTFYRTNSRNVQILNSLKNGECKNGTCSL
jgi:ribonucleotide reductase alpha subunit